MVSEGGFTRTAGQAESHAVGAGQAGASHNFWGALSCGKVSRYAYKHQDHKENTSGVC